MQLNSFLQNHIKQGFLLNDEIVSRYERLLKTRNCQSFDEYLQSLSSEHHVWAAEKQHELFNAFFNLNDAWVSADGLDDLEIELKWFLDLTNKMDEPLNEENWASVIDDFRFLYENAQPLLANGKIFLSCPLGVDEDDICKELARKNLVLDNKVSLNKLIDAYFLLKYNSNLIN